MENISISMKHDEKDFKILELLKVNSQLTTSKISKKLNIPITTVHNRIKKLKSSGIIRNFSINLNHDLLGKPLTAYILMTVNQNAPKKTSQQAIGKSLLKYSEVESVDIVTGTTDLLIKTRIKSMSNLSTLLTKKFRSIEGVDKTQTIMVLEELF